jgi:trans-2,3-dihydro-3-hydroxyanthranilate isomerase
MPLSYLHYDVFTNDPLAGNQLAVFPEVRGLNTARMQRIAREMNFSESTFIFAPEQPGTDVRMRIFTPYVEMPMAGHPTIGSTFALAHTGVIPYGAHRFVFGLNVGPTPVDLEWKDSVLAFAWMTQLRPTFGPPIEARAAVAAAIGLSENDLVPDLPVQEITCGTPFVFVALRDRGTVDRASGDLASFKKLPHGVAQMPIFLFAVDPDSSGASVYSRMFAPDFGIIEDPATGGASGPLGCFLVQHGLVSGQAAKEIVSYQGVAMGRPSRIHIAIGGRPNAITDVKVGGEAVLVGRGEIVV